MLMQRVMMIIMMMMIRMKMIMMKMIMMKMKALTKPFTATTKSQQKNAITHST